MKKMIALLCVVVLAACAVIGVTNVRSSNKIKDLNTNLAALQDTVAESQKTVEEKTAEIETLTAEAAEKASQIETLTADVADKEAQIETLTADVADKEAQIETLTASVAEMKAQIEGLNADAAARAEEIASLNAQAAEAQSAIEALTAEAAEKAAAIESLSADLDEAQQKLKNISDVLNPGQAGSKMNLPQAGDEISGFTVKETRDFPLIGAELVLFEHQKTGALLMYIANEDTNRVFDLTFRTRPIDNTGLPHVFEHSTLNGSEKYPSTALFMNLAYQTYNTYMNAFTMDAMTSYPIASLSEAQLLKYADFYTDSCLHPMVLQDESIYRTEAWRYRMADADSELTIEGTVYSEMQGAYDIDEAAMLNANRLAFPGAAIGLCYGGDPDYIPDMTWEALKEYHERFYHPSNSIAYLYGQFDDYAAFLDLLNGYYDEYEKAEFVYEDSDYTPITSPVQEKIAFPTEEGTSTENASVIYYYIICPGLRDDPAQEQVIDNLCQLLNADSSVMMQSLQKALPTGEFSIGREVAAPDDGIVFVASNVGEDDADLFRDTVDGALRQIAEEGFAQDMVDGIMAALSLNQKLVGENSSLGVNIIPSIAYSYVTTGNPFDYMEGTESLDLLDDWNQAGLFQQAIKDWMLDKQTTALVTTYPQPGQKEVKDAALAEKLAAVKEAMTEEEKQAIIDFTNSEREETDATAMVASLQAVNVQSLPEEYRVYDITNEVGEDGIRRVEATANVDGVGQTALFLYAHGLPQEDIHWFKLYTYLVGQLDTDSHTKEEMDVLISRYLYNFEFRLSLMGDKDIEQPYLRMGWIATDEDLAAGYDLMWELAFGTRFDDVQKLGEKIAAAKASLRSAINGGPYNVMLYRGFGVNNAKWRYYSYINYLEYYAFLEQAEELLAQSPETVTEKLEAVQQYFNNSTGAMSVFAGNENSIALNRPLADAFLEKLEKKDMDCVKYDLPVPSAREALIADINVQFNNVIADFDSLDLEGYDASLDAVTTLVTDTFLIPQLRDGYGVYTPWNGAIDGAGVYMITYRDPNVRETFEVYASLPEQIAALSVDQATLDGYILNAYSALAQGSGELTGAMAAAVNLIDGIGQEKTLEYMQQLKAVTPESMANAAELYQKLWDNGVHSTAGSASAINANTDLFDVILNPFNAQDASQVTLSDVTEDYEYYEAVRTVYENGLMVPASDDAFGVDEPATVGDLVGAFYVMIGGPAGNPEEAVAYLGQFGIVPDGAEAGTEMTHGMSDQIFVAFGEAVGLPLEADEPNETTDQIITRGELADQIKMLWDAVQ
ncbi:MAG: insulinase family protein [Clostridia bacterium]|nr:insulinase family protein [Clostridia bacterium]